jgi:hypothetical protein
MTDDPFLAAGSRPSGIAPDPFAAAGSTPMVGDMPAAEPSKPGEGDARRYTGVLDALGQNLGDAGRAALHFAVDTVPAAFQRKDISPGSDPFQTLNDPVSAAGGKVVINPDKWKSRMAGFANALRTNPEDMFSNLRTGFQRNIGADLGAPVSLIDLAARGAYYGTQFLHNTIPPLRTPVTTGSLDWYLNPFHIPNTIQGRKPPEAMLGPFTSGAGGPWLWDDYDGYGPTPEQWTTPYDESGFKFQPAARLNEEINIPSLDLGAVRTPAVHIPKHEMPLPDMAAGMKLADDAVTGAGKLLGKLTGDDKRFDWSPYEPKTPIEQVAQEMMGGVVAPGPFLMRMALPAVSALIGQIPGIKGTAFELPARLAGGVVTGKVLSDRAGVVSPAGKVLRENTTDLASGGAGTGQPARSARQNLTEMEPYQKEMADAGLSVLPGELMAGGGRGDVPKIVDLTQKAAKTGPGGELVRENLRTRPGLTASTLQDTIDRLLGPAPGNRMTFSDELATTAGHHVQDFTTDAQTAASALAGVKGRVGPEGVQGVIRNLDRALLGDRQGMATNSLSGLRGDLVQAPRPLRAVGADSAPGGPRITEPVTDLRTLHRTVTEWQRRLDAGEIHDAARPAVEQAIGDLKTHMKTASPAYAAASLDAQVAAEDAAKAAGSPVGRIAKAPELEAANPNSALKSAQSLLLDPANATPESLTATARVLNAHNPDLFRGLVSDWINKKLSTAIGQGANPEMGARFAKSVFGDPQSKSLLKAALDNVRDAAGNPINGEQLLRMFPALEAMDVLPKRLGTAPSNMSLLPQKGAVRSGVRGVADTVPGLKQVLARRDAAREAASAVNLDRVLGSPTGIKSMLDLMYRVPEQRYRSMLLATGLNESRNVGRSIMFGTGGGFPPPGPAPLLYPDDIDPTTGRRVARPTNRPEGNPPPGQPIEFY